MNKAEKPDFEKIAKTILSCERINEIRNGNDYSRTMIDEIVQALKSAETEGRKAQMEVDAKIVDNAKIKYGYGEQSREIIAQAIRNQGGVK